MSVTEPEDPDRLAPPSQYPRFSPWMALGATICLLTVPYHVRASEGQETPKIGLASWYSVEACAVNPDPHCPTASGKSLYALIEQRIPYAAMWEVPLGSWCTVQGPAGSSRVVVVDRGPAKRLGRLIDLNPVSFIVVCGSLQQGTCQVEVR